MADFSGLRRRRSATGAHVSPGNKVTATSVGRQKPRKGHPPTNGKAGGKLPRGKAALRSPARSFSAASRKAATNRR